jgi:hypothetical protein
LAGNVFVSGNFRAGRTFRSHFASTNIMLRRPRMS